MQQTPAQKIRNPKLLKKTYSTHGWQNVEAVSCPEAAATKAAELTFPLAPHPSIIVMETQ